MFYFNREAEMKHSPDKKALENWEHWMKIRKKMHDKLNDVQQRQPHQMVMNSTVNFRRIKEEKLMIDAAAKIPILDCWRGNPNFFSIPPPSKKFPELISVPTKSHNFEMPKIDRVTVPPYIEKETDIVLPSKENDTRNELWYKSQYRKDRIKQLKQDLKRVQHHEPDTGNFVIIGKRPKSLVNKCVNEYNVSDNSQGETIIDEEHTQSDKDFVVSLQIEDNVFNPDTKQQDLKECCIFIEYDIITQDIVERELVLKNVGTVSIKYYWMRAIPIQPLNDIMPQRLPSCEFVFKKNLSVILPGETQTFKFYFKTNKRGIYKEIWKLVTMPSIIKVGNFCLNLYAIAERNNFEEIENAIRERINTGVKYTIVEDTLLEALLRAKILTTDEQSSPEYIVTEKDLFEASNVEFGAPGTLPIMYYYDEQVVQTLKDLYDKLKEPNDPDVWNYRIKDLRTIILKCTDMETRYQYTTTFEETINSLVMTNHIENVEQYKYNKVYNYLCVMIDKMTDMIYEYRNIYKVSIIEVYPAVTRKILQQEDALDDNYRSTRFFQDITERNIIKNVRVCKEDEGNKPAPEYMKNIPLDDIRTRYKVYQKEKYGIIRKDSTDALKKKASKSKTKNLAKKSSVHMTKTTAKKSSISMSIFTKPPSLTGLLTNEIVIKTNVPDKEPDDEKEKRFSQESKRKIARSSFNVNQKDKPSTATIQSKEKVSSSILEQKLKEKLSSFNMEQNANEETNDDMYMYKYNIYVHIYTILSETVSHIDAFMEHISQSQRISRDTLKKCIQLGFPTFQPRSEQMVTEAEFDAAIELSHRISDLSITSSPPYTEMTKITGTLADLSRSYSSYSSIMPNSSDTQSSHVYTDGWTQTSGEELFPPKIRDQTNQTEAGHVEFDLVELIEKEMSATSIQFIVAPTADKSIQTVKMEQIDEN